MQQATKDSDGASLENSDSDDAYTYPGLAAMVRAQRHRNAQVRNFGSTSITEMLAPVIPERHHQHRQSDGSSGSIRRSPTYSTQDRAHLIQRSGGPVIRPRSKTYLTGTLSHSKISQHSGLHGDSSMPTTISKDTTQGVEAKNKSLLATFGTKTKLLNQPLNPPLTLDASREGSSQRPAIAEKYDSGMKDDALKYLLDTIGLAKDSLSSISLEDQVKNLAPEDQDALLRFRESIFDPDSVAEVRRMHLRAVQRQYRKKLKRRLENVEAQDRLGTHLLGFSLPDDGETEKQHQLARNQPFTAQATNIASALNIYRPQHRSPKA